MFTQTPYKSPRLRLTFCILCIGSLLLLGCPTDNAPLKQENLQLKKQAAKLESVVLSLQEGNKVTQQQIDLLNREARKAEVQFEQQLKAEKEKLQNLLLGNKQENANIQQLKEENEKLKRDARWLRTLREHMRKGLKVQQENGNTERLNASFQTVIAVAQATLTKNGYTILASMQTDQKAVYITNRKTSTPASLEVTGFRNQYILTIDQQSGTTSDIWVKADFEKLTQNGQILEASNKELNAIELRLIQEIQQNLVTQLPKLNKK